MFITSNEEIRGGDWILEFNSLGNKVMGICKAPDIIPGECILKKIILTTNQDLIKDGVQAIDDDFLEWFVKNPSCEEVELKKGFADGTAWGYNFLDYKIIIPKEEQCTCKKHDPYCCQIHGSCPTCIKKEESKDIVYYCKQGDPYCVYPKCICNTVRTTEELTISCGAKQIAKNYMSLKSALEPKQATIEEAAEHYGWRIKTNSFSDRVKANELAESAKQDFIKGAKWQQERNYSVEDLVHLLNFVSKEYNISNGIGWFHTHESIEDISSIEVLEKWFEQHKKK